MSEQAASSEYADWGGAQRELMATIQAASPNNMTATLSAFAHALAKLNAEQIREIAAIVNTTFNQRT